MPQKTRSVRRDIGYDPVTKRRIRKMFTGKSLREANAKADEFMRKIDLGMDIVTAQAPLSKWIDRWLDRPDTNRSYSSALDRRIYPVVLSDSIGSMRLDTIRPYHIQAVVDHYQDKSPAWMSKFASYTKRIFSAAVDNRILEFDPTRGVEFKTTKQKGSHRLLEQWEIDAVRAHWREYPLGFTHYVILYTGLRIGEASALEWKDIDYENKVIHVTGTMGLDPNCEIIKTNGKTAAAQRDIPILPQLMSALREEQLRRGAITGKVCLYNGRPIDFRHASKACNDSLSILSGIIGKDIAFRHHDLRHTYASILFEAGVSVKQAQAWLGHTDIKTTLDIYTHLSKSMTATEVDKLTTFVSKVAQ